jgi:REP element-mobilizing transposase RayT
MPQSLVKILVHIVFSTKNRANIISSDIEESLFGYISGIVQNNGSKLIIANGTQNHIHLLVSLGKTVEISKLVGDIKRDSSKWIKTQGAEFQDFFWQEGYGAFSIGQSQIDEVVKYIAKQKTHHTNSDFKDEFLALLNEV